MKKHLIGFNTKPEEEIEIHKPMEICKGVIQPKKAVVRVYFPHRDMSWTYYNDMFDLNVGDFVYVEGKLEGYRGQVTEVNYSFKIKLSDYKRVVAVIDMDIKGDFFLAGSHVVSFDRKAIPSFKVSTWFNAPENDDEYVIGNDATLNFPLDDLSEMKIPPHIADRGHKYYMENKVAYVEIDGTQGYAIVEGSENYRIEFNYSKGEISNLKCSCFYSGTCKHEFAVMLQLRETIELITENYENEYNGYFAIISKGMFVNTVMSKKVSGKITLEV